jgi:hypothetical protein
MKLVYVSELHFAVVLINTLLHHNITITLNHIHYAQFDRDLMVLARWLQIFVRVPCDGMLLFIMQRE